MNKKKYVVGFVFDYFLNKVLLLKRHKAPYLGYYNGIGGKVKESEEPYQAMLRETIEETGINNDRIFLIRYLLKEFFPASNVELYVFYIVLKEGDNLDFVDSEEGKLEWVELYDKKFKLFNVFNNKLAGEGNVPYYLRYSLMDYNMLRM